MPDIAPNPPLAQEINTATRSLHTRLNALISKQLVTGLPPHNETPAIYTLGFIEIASIFKTFEQPWDNLKSAATGPDPDRTLRLHQQIKNLRPPDLERTPRFQADLKALRKAAEARMKEWDDGRENEKLNNQVLERIDTFLESSSNPQTEPATQATAPGTARKDTQQTNHILLSKMSTNISARPYLLLAYGWVWYMAIFSGGRFIRDELAKASPDFWAWGGSSGARPLARIAFLTFPPDTDDGLDIKHEFKTRMGALEDLLTAEERRQIVDEARWIFESTIDLVNALGARLDDHPALTQGPTPPHLLMVKVVQGAIGVALAASLLYQFWGWVRE